MAGIEPPANMQGRLFLGSATHKRDFIIAARDRCDHTVDRIRCVAPDRFKYIRNFMPERPYTQLNRYVEHKFAVFKVLKWLHAIGELTPEQELFMATQRPVEELYDVQTDPYEVHNLAMTPAYRRQLEQLQGILDRWIHETRDQGAILEDHEVIEKWDRIAGVEIARRRKRKSALRLIAIGASLNESLLHGNQTWDVIQHPLSWPPVHGGELQSIQGLSL